MYGSNEARLRRLESMFIRRTCPTCHDRPSRLVGVDEIGNTVSENMPDTGCPDCGRAPIRTHIRGGLSADMRERLFQKAG